MRKLTVLTVVVLVLGMVASASAGKLQTQLTQESTLEQIREDVTPINAIANR